MSSDSGIIAVGATDSGPFAVTQHGNLQARPGDLDLPALSIPADWLILHRVAVLANGRWIVALAGDASLAHGILAWPLEDKRPPLRMKVDDPELGVHASRSVIASAEGGEANVLVFDLELGNEAEVRPFPLAGVSRPHTGC